MENTVASAQELRSVPLWERWLSGQHVSQLDGVRGIAIVMVTLYRFMKEIDGSASSFLFQLRSFAPIGERGVDLFFVLSGLLITGILLRTKSRPAYFRNFILRRALRIFPLYFLTLAVVLYVLPSYFQSSRFEVMQSEHIYLWTYTSNLRMSWLNAWMFGPLDHFWSLAVEEHFYLVWPLLVYIIAPRYLFWGSIGWVGIVFLTRTYFASLSGYDVAVQVNTFFRSDALLLGSVIAIALFEEQYRHWIRFYVAPLTIFTLLLSCMFVVANQRFLAIPNTIVPILFAGCLYMILQEPAEHWWNRMLKSKTLTWFGKYSYGMYVVQLPLVTLIPAANVVPALSPYIHAPYLCYGCYIAMMVGLTTLLAWCSYHAIERHFLRLKIKFH